MAEQEASNLGKRSEPDLPEVVLVQVRTGMWQGTTPLKPDDIGKSEDEVP